MTVPVSTMPTVLAWLVAQLQAKITATVGESAGVYFGPESQYESDDVVRVQSGQRSVVPLAITGDMGAWSMQESYDVTVTVTVSRGGEDFLAAETRAWALLAVVESVVRSDLWALIAAQNTATLGGNVYNLSVNPHAATSEWAADDSGPLIDLPYSFTVTAAI